MDLSKSQSGPQSTTQFELCESDPKISRKCFNIFMCIACKNNIHPENETAWKQKNSDIKQIRDYRGRTTSDIRDGPASVDVSVVEEYQTTLKGVFQLAVNTVDDSFWIGDGDHNKELKLFTSHTALQKIKPDGNMLKVIYSFNFHIYDMAITPDNDLLIATDGPILKLISGKNKIKDSVYDLDPYQPLCIHVTKDNNVIVGAGIEGRKERIIIVMDQEGNNKNVYDEDMIHGISFTSPLRLTVNNNDNIFVIDMMHEEHRGRVVVLGKDNIINTYSGHSTINTEDRPFIPSDLTATPANNVIVVDMYTSSLHILNSPGNLITYISTAEKGIVQNPFSICLAMEENVCILFMGTITKTDSNEKSKLYKLHLIGC